jgi:hypothetical protein
MPDQFLRITMDYAPYGPSGLDAIASRGRLLSCSGDRRADPGGEKPRPDDLGRD